MATLHAALRAARDCLRERTRAVDARPEHYKLVEELAAELGVALGCDAALLSPTFGDARLAVSELLAALEREHLSAEARARVAPLVDRLKPLGHSQRVAGIAVAREATP